MSFRNRLALFLVCALVIVQGCTAAYAYFYLRQDAVERDKRELGAAMGVFTRQINFLATRVADDVAVLSLDYALRSAIAKSDHATELTALRNHGDRIGAARMMMVGLDGLIDTDTGAPRASGETFPFPTLLATAAADGKATTLARLGQRLCWIVVVPVLAPVPIAFIAACIPVDDGLLAKLSTISAIPRSISLSARDQSGRWRITAQTGTHLRNLNPASLEADKTVVVKGDDGEEYLAVTAPLSSASTPVHATMAYPLNETLGVYQSLILHLMLVFGGVLLAALAGTMLIARGFSRPLEMLAVTARRIAAGDYRPPPPSGGHDEIAHLTRAFRAMAGSIAERTSAMTHALQAAETARADASRANEAKSQFLANMSHELRTPLNAIVGFSEMLEQQVLGPIGVPRYGEYARDIHASGRHLLGLVERILELSDIESSKLELVPGQVKLDEILAGCVFALIPFAERGEVGLSLDNKMADWPFIEGDAARLSQAFANLLHNAVKFTRPGGTVRVSGERDGAHLVVRIADTGIGMDPDMLALVVKPFHRLRSALDGQHQGAGLGLPFAKKIVEMHGGTLTMKSAPGAGTTICIELHTANIARAAA